MPTRCDKNGANVDLFGVYDKGSAESSIKQKFRICTSCKMKYNICKGQSQMDEYRAAELSQAALYWDI